MVPKNVLWLKTVCVLLLPFFSVISLEPLVKNSNNYGPYILIFDHYGTCKGPKSKDLATMTTVLNNGLIASVNFTFLVDAKIDEIKVQLNNIKDNKRNFMWNYKLSDPCKHYAIAAMIKEHLKADNCVVKKGNYTNIINFKEVMNAFLGTSFFYGTYNYKSDISSKKGNIACYNSTMTFKKKTEV